MGDDNERREMPFTQQDELRWHQLDLLRRVAGEPGSRPEASVPPTPESMKPRPLPEPYQWQLDALRSWEAAGRRGVVKVVTGAGKTQLALMVLQRLWEEDQSVRASIIVPTRVLLDQWYGELTGRIGLGSKAVGRRSGDHDDDFADPHRRVMIYVLNSARTALGEGLSQELRARAHFLVVDECHRAGSRENARIFDVPRSHSLGLSATPERGEDAETLEEDVPEVIQMELGPIIFELTFVQALQEGIIPEFEILHVAVELNPDERAEYDELTSEMDGLKKKLRTHPEFLRRHGKVGNEFQLIRFLSRQGESDIAQLAARYEGLSIRRKELLYRAKNRYACFRDILEEVRKDDANVLVFHERIPEINSVFGRLVREGIPVVLDHTGLTETQRERSLKMYLTGRAPILLSVKALIEGVNAPATDVGVIMAASSSPRQKIQSIGRVLRRYPGKERSRVYNIYVRNSADEYVFRQVNWDKVLGVGRSSFLRWTGLGHWTELGGPPFEPLPAETEIDESSLQPGDPYPGDYEGQEASIDTRGSVFREVNDGTARHREYTQLPNSISQGIFKLKSRGGRFMITPQRRHVLVRTPNAEGDWTTYFVGKLSEDLTWTAGGGAANDPEGVVLQLVTRAQGVCLAVGSRGARAIDCLSPAALQIREMLQQERLKPKEILVQPSGTIFARSEGVLEELGKLDTQAGWPFGHPSFEELKEARNGTHSR